MTQNFQGGVVWLAAAEGEAHMFAVPSGQSVMLQDVFWEEGDSLVLRVRFLTPQISRAGGTIDYDTAAIDMLHLCETYVIPQLAESAEIPDQIILSFSDINVPFGEADPAATQFFEAYSIENNACIWEVY
ncbi:DUF6497 family protein [Pseudorhodobacter sp.]|uniref:DUF6497 family protein n=1 Tax=Pseudorhodobacter sp. TaxID=1934400 RepID=UPI002AFF5669|nr:DUF6497 family protein [Pseudorhodobacter sp.]